MDTWWTSSARRPEMGRRSTTSTGRDGTLPPWKRPWPGTTLSELTAIGKPAVIVPSPNVTNHHQERNANVLAQAGGAVVLLEPVCSGETLYRTTQDLLADEPRRKTMAQAMANMGIPQAGEKIYETLLTLVNP